MADVLSGARFREIAFAFLAAAISGVFIAGCGGGGGGGGSEESFSLPTPPVPVQAEVVAEHLDAAAGLVFLPDGRLLFTEIGSGDIRTIKGGTLLPKPYAHLETSTTPSAGLLGIAADSDFSMHPFVYVFQNAENPPRSRVVRFSDANGQGTEPVVILDGIPVGGHDGGKILSHPDGTIYITGGDAGDPANSQNPATLAGKMFHVTREGAPAPGNPDGGSPIVASGIRNAFGIALQPVSHAVYFSENGPDCNDEVDLLRPGANYGWRPGQPCNDTDPNFEPPLAVVTPTVGVTGAVFYTGAMFPELANQLLVGDYNTGAVRRFAIDENGGAHVVEEAVLYPGGAGPIVDLAVGPDGAIYATTLDTIFRLVRPAASDATPAPAPSPDV